MKKDLLSFFKENKKKFALLLMLYLLATLAIGMANYPYIDDIGRQVTGQANFAEAYARYFSEYASWLVQGNSHLTDMGLATPLLSASLLTLTSFLALFALSDGENLSWASAVASAFIGINPWFTEALSFRFDSPYIVLSVLVSVLPFIYYHKLKEAKQTGFFLLSLLGIFLMLNTYQASSGLYIVLLLTLIYKDLLAGETWQAALKRGITGAAAYLTALLLYLLQLALNPQLADRGDNTKLAEWTDLPRKIIENIRVYFDTLRAQSTSLWLFLFALLAALFIFQTFQYSRLKRGQTLALTVFYLLSSASLSFGLYSAFAITLADDRPRYIYGFAFFLSMIFILAGKDCSLKKQLNTVKLSTAALLIYYTLAFVFSYANTLYHQKETFERQSALLAGDLNQHLTSKNQTVYINKLFKDSAVYHNTLTNYPILDELIPRNADLYWPNVLWFNTLTHLDVSLTKTDIRESELRQADRLVSNPHYSIYRHNSKLYINMKH